jgi:hypothetical protein
MKSRGFAQKVFKARVDAASPPDVSYRFEDQPDSQI